MKTVAASHSGHPMTRYRRRGVELRDRSGSSLLLVFWAITLLSMSVIAWAKWINQDIALDGQANRDSEARAMAHSGMALALHPLVGRQSPQLTKDFGSQLGYSVQMVGEGGKLNVNWLLAGEDPRKLNIFKLWLERMGLDFHEREVLVDCLLDYVDADNLKRLNGMEDEGDYHPANRPLLTLDELREVKGCEPLTNKPGWKDNLTLYSGGLIDVLAAPPEVFRALPGFGDAMIERFVTYRSGKDGILGNADDPIFNSLREVQFFLGLNDVQFKALGGLLGMRDPVMHITAKGFSGKVIRQVDVVARKGVSNPAILYWTE